MERRSKDQRSPLFPEAKRMRPLSPIWEDTCRERCPSIQCLGRLTLSLSATGCAHQRTGQVESNQVSPPSSPDSQKFSTEEDGSSGDDSDVSSLHPKRDKLHRHWDK